VAITFESAASFDNTFDSGGTAVSNAFDAGSASDRILIVFVGFNNSAGHTLTGVTYNGVALTAFGGQVSAGGVGMRGYYLVNPASGSNTLTVDPAAGAGSAVAVITAMIYSGVDVGGTPWDGYNPLSSAANDQTAENTITSESGDMIVVAATGRGTANSAASPTNYTERFDNANTTWVMAGGDAAGAATVATTTTFNGSPMNGWVVLGLNLNAAAGGGGGTVSPYYSGYYKSIVLGLN
jgi:hypothetical protein